MIVYCYPILAVSEPCPNYGIISRAIVQQALAKDNLSIIYDNPNAIFKAGEDGKLETISKFNLFGRAVEWIRNLASGGKRRARTVDTVRQSFATIHESLEKKEADSCYIQDRDRSSSLIHKLGAPQYRYNRPLNEDFSHKLITSRLNHHPDIIELAVKIKLTATPLLAEIPEDRKVDLFEKPLGL